MRKDLGLNDTVNDVKILIVGLNFEPNILMSSNVPCILEGKQSTKC